MRTIATILATSILLAATLQSADMPSKITTEARAAIRDLEEPFRLSLPFPAKLNGKARIGVLVYNAVARPNQPSAIYPPAWILYIHETTGKLIQRTALPNPPNREPIGTHGIPSGLTLPEFLSMEAKIHTMVSKICVRRNAGKPIPEQPYADLFHKLEEKPLRPYYTKYGEIPKHNPL